jgi:mono/diheme cytochrome c family protein
VLRRIERRDRVATRAFIHRSFVTEGERTTMRRASIGLIAAVIFSFVSISAQTPGGNPEAKKLKNPVKATPQSIAVGKELYAKSCRGCHGPDGKGEGPGAPKDSHPSNLTDQEWTRGSSDGEIYAVLRDGAGPKFIMRGYKSRMTEQELWSIVNYLRSINVKAAH